MIHPGQNNKPMATRRQFLKSLSLTIGSVTLSSLALDSACTPTDSRTTSTTSAQTVQTSGQITSSIPSSSAPSMTLMEVPGTTVKVASDRLYSMDHIWVLATSTTEVKLGITDKIQALMEAVKSITLPKQGTSTTLGDAFGFIEGYKMNMDLISPVSGTVAAINPEMNNIKETEYGPLNLDPYGKGWIMSVKLSKTEELKELLSAGEYVTLTTGAKTAT